MILVDTSVWADHVRRGNAGLRFALDRDSVITHEFVLGELFIGHIRNGSQMEPRLLKLRVTPTLSHDSVLRFVRAHRLQGTGIGWMDAHLLASADAARTTLWTLDKRLADQARRLGLAQHRA